MATEADFPSRFPRVPAVLEQGPSGPVWRFVRDGVTRFRGFVPLPALVMLDGRNVLLVERNDNNDNDDQEVNDDEC